MTTSTDVGRATRAAVPAPLAALAPGTWEPAARAHAARADDLTAVFRERHARREKHAIEDFLFTYYAARPARLRRWHPGVGVALLPADGGLGVPGAPDDRSQSTDPDGVAERLTWRWHSPAPDGGVTLDVAAFLADRGDTVRYVHDLLDRTASRPANVGCFGLHEWAMVYRQGDATRHPLPLRLGPDGTDAVVESHPVRCSHFDAFRFFTPEAVPLNRLQPTRATQPELEQPGCLHANMDLFKWAEKLGPAVPGDLLLDCFELARDVRYLDMQASPYDVSSYGLDPVAIETPDGRAEYSARQRSLADRAAPLRARIVATCDALLAHT